MQEYISKLYNSLVESTEKCKSNYISFSGGLDSTIIAYLLKDRIHGVSVIVSDYTAPDNTFIEIAKEEFNIPVETKYVNFEKLLPVIDELIKIFKNFNFIEIRNFVGMYLTFEMAKNNGQNSIITGDAADELFGGYNFLFTKKENEIDETLKKIWNVMEFPSSKIAKHFNIEVEHPYLDENVKRLAEEIPIEFKVRSERDKMYGKWILRKAFENTLPANVIWREKTAMQDGSGTTNLTKLFHSIITDDIFAKKTKKIKSECNIKIRTKESLYYYELFKENFVIPKCEDKKNICPDCNTEIANNSKFCRMCGKFPI